MKTKSKILVIAGSDSSGGAGIQGDIKTITSLGGYAMTAITAITVQNTMGVKSVTSLKSQDIKNQILFTCKDIKPDVIKIGMLHSSNVIKIVANSIKNIGSTKIILDPVMIAKGGSKLLNNSAVKTLKSYLISKTFLLTPNIPEAEVLTNMRIKSSEDMIKSAKFLLSWVLKTCY